MESESRWIEHLTGAEMETMMLLSKGYSTRTIAKIRRVKVRSVYIAMQNVRMKYSAKTRDEAMACFIMHTLAGAIAQSAIVSSRKEP